MNRYLIAAFALGALFDHILYQKTKALKEITRNVQVSREKEVALEKTPTLPNQENIAQAEFPPAPRFPEKSATLSDIKFQEETLSPGIHLDPTDMAGSAFDVAKKLVQNFGIAPSRVKVNEDANVETSRQAVFNFQQTYDNYDVYQSSLRIVALKDTSDVLLLSNQLREVENYTAEINHDALQSEKIVQAQLNDFNPKIYKTPTDPVVWPSNESELAWVYLVRVTSASTPLVEVAIGAHSGKLLMAENASESAAAFKANFDPDCLTKTSAAPNEACLFFKNPAYSARQEYNTQSLYSSNLPYYWYSAKDAGKFQHHSVILRDLDTTGFLQSSYISVTPGVKTVARAVANKDGTWRFPYSLCVSSFCQEDTKQKYSQVNAYYWANELRHFMKERTGKFYAEKFTVKTKVTITTSISNYLNASNYVPGLRTVNLYVKPFASGKLKWNEQDPVLAEQIMHEYGHANLQAANNVSTTNYAKTTIPSLYACKSAQGCYLALSEAIAFLHSALPFESPKIFETHSISGEGSYNLDVASYADESAAAAYKGVYPQGEAHEIGIIYASIWWNVRKNWCKNYPLETSDDARKIQIDTLFTQHLPLIQLSDTIPTAVAKIAKLARSLKGYGEAYAKAFETELSRRYDKVSACASLNRF